MDFWGYLHSPGDILGDILLVLLVNDRGVRSEHDVVSTASSELDLNRIVTLPQGYLELADSLEEGEKG